MKRVIVAAFFAVSMTLAPMASHAALEYDDTQSHPLRVAAYLLHPVGVAAEWLIFRPLYFVFSSAPTIFGHRAHGETVVD